MRDHLARLQAFCFLDLSRRRDLTSRVVVVRDRPRRPEAVDHLVCVAIRVWDPRLSPSGEVDFREVREDLGGLPKAFPGLTIVRIDEGAEAGSVLPWAKAHPMLTNRVEGFVPTPQANMELWGALAARFHAGTLSIPRHERLLAELRSLRAESFSLGSRWRVVDSSQRLHRDVSLALAGAVHAADSVQRSGEHSPVLAGGTRAMERERLLEVARGAGIITSWEERSAAAEAARSQGPGGANRGGLVI